MMKNLNQFKLTKQQMNQLCGGRTVRCKFKNKTTDEEITHTVETNMTAKEFENYYNNGNATYKASDCVDVSIEI